MFCLFMYYRFSISFVLLFLAYGGRCTGRDYRPQAAVLKSFLPICARCLFIVRRFGGCCGCIDETTIQSTAKGLKYTSGQSIVF